MHWVEHWSRGHDSPHAGFLRNTGSPAGEVEIDLGICIGPQLLVWSVATPIGATTVLPEGLVAIDR